MGSTRRALFAALLLCLGAGGCKGGEILGGECVDSSQCPAGQRCQGGVCVAAEEGGLPPADGALK